MKQKEIIDWAMLAVQQELLQHFLTDEERELLERKYKELAEMCLEAIRNDAI